VVVGRGIAGIELFALQAGADGSVAGAITKRGKGATAAPRGRKGRGLLASRGDGRFFELHQCDTLEAHGAGLATKKLWQRL